MKKRPHLVMVCGFVFSALFSVAQTPNADSIVHRTFAALKAGDKNAFVALFPAYEPFKKFMLQTLLTDKRNRPRDTTLPVNVDSLEQEFVANLTEEAYIKEVADNFAKPFQKIWEQGMDKGLNWEHAVLINYTLTKTPETENIPVMEGVMDIRDSMQDYQLAFNQIVWFEPEGSWFGINLKNLVRKGEPLETDFSLPDSADMVFDSTAVMVTDTIETMPITQPPVKKTPVKKPVRKTASKAQPAKKANAKLKH